MIPAKHPLLSRGSGCWQTTRGHFGFERCITVFGDTEKHAGCGAFITDTMSASAVQGSPPCSEVQDVGLVLHVELG